MTNFSIVRKSDYLQIIDGEFLAAHYSHHLCCHSFCLQFLVLQFLMIYLFLFLSF